MTPNMRAKAELTVSVVFFGTIGLFVRYIPLSSAVISMVRGFIGAAFVLLFLLLRKKSISKQDIWRNKTLLFISGAAMGFNWILLFEAYRYTTVATATLCYYLAPVFVILASPVLFREKLTVKKGICVALALLGMVFVTGVPMGVTSVSAHSISLAEAKGILFGIGAAVLYASEILMNKKMMDISAYDKTFVQLGTAAAVLLPYILLTQTLSFSIDGVGLVCLLVLCIFHTGICYILYFAAMNELPVQTVAIFSYIDPIVAILLSALLLKEPLGIGGIIGAVLVLGSTLLSELPQKE